MSRSISREKPNATYRVKVLTAKAEAHSYFEGTTIKVRVGNGDGLKTFIIHKEFGISRSPFFANALREGSPWASAEDGVIWLQEEDPEVFDVYMHLIYHNRIPVDEVMAWRQFWEVHVECGDDPEDAHDAYVDHVEEVTAKRCELLAKLHVFCDMIQDIRAKNQVISAFAEEISSIAELAGGERIAYPCLSAICIVYRHAPHLFDRSTALFTTSW